MVDGNKPEVLNLDLDNYILGKQREAILNTEKLLLKNLSNSNIEIISGIQSRAKESPNEKVRNHVIDKFLKGFMADGYSGNVQENLEESRTGFKTLIEDPSNEEYGKYYPGWTKEDFLEVYRILYDNKEREVKSIVLKEPINSEKLVTEIESRLEESKNKKVCNRVKIYLENFKKYPNLARGTLIDIENDFLNLIDGVADEDLNGRYAGWDKEDFKEIYRLLYGEKR